MPGVPHSQRPDVVALVRGVLLAPERRSVASANTYPNGKSHPHELDFSEPCGTTDARYNSALSLLGAVAQLVRVPDCRSGGCGFESRRPRCSKLTRHR